MLMEVTLTGKYIFLVDIQANFWAVWKSPNSVLPLGLPGKTQYFEDRDWGAPKPATLPITFVCIFTKQEKMAAIITGYTI